MDFSLPGAHAKFRFLSPSLQFSVFVFSKAVGPVSVGQADSAVSGFIPIQGFLFGFYKRASPELICCPHARALISAPVSSGSLCR
jgi:hypothetical protein